jgi:hypothetical protein
LSRTYKFDAILGGAEGMYMKFRIFDIANISLSRNPRRLGCEASYPKHAAEHAVNIRKENMM